nr:soluble scavenger receptor cysteine-rich domain-containing protein SSC5D-like [Lytechinus pictus]
MIEWTMLSAAFLPSLLLLQVVTISQGQNIRLQDGGPTYGRLEILYNGEWGTVCDDNFGLEDAQVACRELGLDSLLTSVYGGSRYGPGTGQIWLDEVECTGSESRLASCSHNDYGSHDCSHSEDVGIVCGSTTDSVIGGELRLVNGDSNYGRLEISVNGVWGTVCDDSFDSSDARVACRQLGLDTSTVDYYTSSRFGEGTGSIWLDELGCLGTETTLDSCYHSVFGVHDCTHAEDVGISCGTTNVGGSSGGLSGVGSWIGGAIFIIVICVVAILFRRRRMYAMRQRQTTRFVQPPTTTTVHVTTNPSAPGNTPMPTYHHAPAPQQQPGEPRPFPTQTFTPTYPAAAAAGGAPPANPYPVQAFPPTTQYPAQPPSDTNPYPPPQGAGTAGYPPQPTAPAYPPPSASSAPAYPPPSAASAPAYPPPSAASAPAYPPPSTGDASAYPPQQPYDASAAYPPSNNTPVGDLPPPPSYEDIVKQ